MSFVGRFVVFQSVLSLLHSILGRALADQVMTGQSSVNELLLLILLLSSFNTCNTVPYTRRTQDNYHFQDTVE